MPKRVDESFLSYFKRMCSKTDRYKSKVEENERYNNSPFAHLADVFNSRVNHWLEWRTAVEKDKED